MNTSFFLVMVAIACVENIVWAVRMRKWWMIAFYVVLSFQTVWEINDGSVAH